MNDTPTIRARIHDSAIRRVTRTFAATLADIFTETLQNSRRAGATRVRVAVTGPADTGPLTVTVTDDGAGIADPAVLLSFGENGWSEDLVRREDAAGMGMLSLARRGCTVSSRPRSTDGSAPSGWRVELAPEHFTGEAEAEVHPDDGAPWPHGAAVTFQATESENATLIRRAIGTAAWHYPLPVVFENVPTTPAGGEEFERRAFLDGALHAERWPGLVFGVFKDRWNGFGLNDPDVNFHGLTVSVRLPSVETVAGARWSVAADIVDCPELELVLPARKEAVETPFLDEMREAARLCIYRAMAADPDPRPSFGDRKRAHEADIDIAPQPAELRPWRPGLADVDDWREPPKRPPVGADALLMTCDPEPPEAQAFWRAAERNRVAGRLFEADRRLEGYAWYDAIARVVAIHIEVTADGRTCALDARTPRPAASTGARNPCSSGPRRSASASPSRRTRDPAASSTSTPTSPSRAKPGAGRATPCRWSPRTATSNPGSSRNSCVSGSFPPATTPTRIRGRPSGPPSSRTRSTQRRSSWSRTTRRDAPRSRMPSPGSCSGSSPTTGAPTSPCATAR